MSDKVLRTKRMANKGRANVIIALLRAEIDAWLEDIDILRAEVKAWRDGVSPSDAATTRMQTRIQKAIAATDAAGALEDK